ncbi:OmpA family protein [Cryomorpha ignava]|uniref:OmpA family protein n=1 Tax=Cryomorpha ignava TaxID=101383 RepID=A0A7K3WMM4_9FLAO|nr:OmpA family protein [Cryomorpha ignava]NEN22897.1 OmpA family protein [Cryomorpha ignava]
MKIQSYILLTAILSLFGMRMAHGQNLIPNPGFEELFTQLEYQWVQPQGPYYHYESANPNQQDQPLSGNYENGLCMYNMEPNEYLHVKLLRPLEKGEKYRLEVNARLKRTKSSGADMQRYIGVYFGTEQLSTHVPGDLFFDPQVNLRLPDGEKFEWFQMVDTFTAKGGETHFTMGYFPKTQWLEHREKQQEEFLSDIEFRHKMEQRKKEMGEEKAWLYMSPKDQQAYLKEQKKQKKKNKKKGIVVEKKTSSSNYGRPKSGPDYTQPFGNLPQLFAVRYYFDDLCLAKIPIADVEATCRPENLPEVIATGKVINLRNVFFQTDSATLRPESTFQLEALQRLLSEYSEMRIEIRGYTDNVGDDDYNLDLSSRRAEAVSLWLISKGVVKERLVYKGFGESEPIETNDTEAGRTRNRRVTFYIIEM